MTRMMKLELRDVQTKLLDNDYWDCAFDENAPFIDSYKCILRTGMLEGRPEPLDMHEDAKYYVKKDFLSPFIWRQIQVAACYPESDFVETLSYFLTKNPYVTKLVKEALKLHYHDISIIKSDLNSLIFSLSESGDDDLAVNFKSFYGKL